MNHKTNFTESNEVFSRTIKTCIGYLKITENGAGITELSFVASPQAPTEGQDSTPLLMEAQRQLEEYFDKKRTSFTLPLSPKGTDFQQKVWNALRTIPYGETLSYKQIAELVGSPKACRAVGMANNKNPIAIIIPCHRVIGSNGKLVGYAGGLDLKEQLLKLEVKDRKC